MVSKIFFFFSSWCGNPSQKTRLNNLSRKVAIFRCFLHRLTKIRLATNPVRFLKVLLNPLAQAWLIEMMMAWFLAFSFWLSVSSWISINDVFALLVIVARYSYSFYKYGIVFFIHNLHFLIIVIIRYKLYFIWSLSFNDVMYGYIKNVIIRAMQQTYSMY